MTAPALQDEVCVARSSHRSAPDAAGEGAVFAGCSTSAETLRLQVARIAPYFRVALLTGESGSGKETVARQMHRLSPVAARPFTVRPAVEFAQEQIREQAQDRASAGAPGIAGGTVFLRGVEELQPAAQANLFASLRTLDRAGAARAGRETRVIAACGFDLKGMVAAGRFQRELYQCLSMVEIRVSPLRERIEDLGAIVAMLARNASFSEPELRRMREHQWPGNLRELARFCASAGDGANGLPPFEQRPVPSAGVMRLDEVIERHVMDVLQGCSGNKLKAAELLGISRSTLYRMLDAAAQ